jgi:hypothetical protein
MLVYSARFSAPLIIEFTKKSSKTATERSFCFWKFFKSETYILTVVGDNFFTFNAQETYPLRILEGIGHIIGKPLDKENKLKFFTAEFCLLQALEDLEAAIRVQDTPGGQTEVFRELPGIPEYFLPPVKPGIAMFSLIYVSGQQTAHL